MGWNELTLCSQHIKAVRITGSWDFGFGSKYTNQYYPKTNLQDMCVCVYIIIYIHIYKTTSGFAIDRK